MLCVRFADTGSHLGDHSFFRIFLRVSGVPALSARGQACVGIDLSVRAERRMLNWIPINNRFSAVRLGGNSLVNSSRLVRRCLFVVS